MKRFARVCLAFQVAFNLVIFQLAPVAHAEELTEVTATEAPVSQYATAPVDTDCIVDGIFKSDGSYFRGINTNFDYVWWGELKSYWALNKFTSEWLTGQRMSNFNEETAVASWNMYKEQADFQYLVPNKVDSFDEYQDGFSLYWCEDGRVILYAACKRVDIKEARFTNFPVFTSKEAGEYFYLNKKLRSENELIKKYLPEGYAFNETLGLVKSSSSSVEVGTYDENIGYPINFDYRGNLLSLNTLRSSTWDFYKDGNGNAISRTEQEEKYNIEIFINFDMKNSVMNNITSGNGEFAGMYVPNLEMPARALSYYSGIANSCQCSFEPWSETMKRAFEYFEDKGDLSLSSFDKNAFYYFNTKNLNVWARYFYIDDADNKHFGDWVKWSKEGVSVVHPDDTVSDNAVPCDSSYKSSYLEKEEGYKAEDQNITIDGITINVTPYFEGPEDDPENYPSSDEEGGGSGSSGSGGSGSGIFDTIGELLGNLLAGIVDLITGLLKGLSSAIYKIVKSIKEFFTDISGAGDIFGELFKWMPGEVTVLFTLSIIVAVVCRLMGR